MTLRFFSKSRSRVSGTAHIQAQRQDRDYPIREFPPSLTTLLPSPLEPPARTRDRDRLVHHPLADAEILVHPLPNVLVLASNLVRLETGPDGSPLRGSSQLFNHVRLIFEMSRTKGADHRREEVEVIVETHVKPVDRFIPARNAETAG